MTSLLLLLLCLPACPPARPPSRPPALPPARPPARLPCLPALRFPAGNVTTVTGQPCQFPFLYNNTMVYSCVPIGGGRQPLMLLLLLLPRLLH